MSYNFVAEGFYTDFEPPFRGLGWMEYDVHLRLIGKRFVDFLLVLTELFGRCCLLSSGAFKPECNDLSQFREDTCGPSMPVREFNLIACPLVQSRLKNSLPYLDVNPGRREPSARQARWHCGLFSGLDH